MIYHVTKKANWHKALEQGWYEADSLAAEGFIHLSQEHQIAGVLQRYYQHQNDMVLLHVEESKLTAPLKFELALSVNETFPHLYGRLNMDAVTEVTAIKSS